MNKVAMLLGLAVALVGLPAVPAHADASQQGCVSSGGQAKGCSSRAGFGGPVVVSEPVSTPQSANVPETVSTPQTANASQPSVPVTTSDPASVPQTASTPQVVNAPEPGSLGLLAIGLAAVVLAFRRRLTAN